MLQLIVDGRLPDLIMSAGEFTGGRFTPTRFFIDQFDRFARTFLAFAEASRQLS
jgi:hypothetical protein